MRRFYGSSDRKPSGEKELRLLLQSRFEERMIQTIEKGGFM